jgi:acyl-coenzyme A thioesterase PaaI-like protein
MNGESGHVQSTSAARVPASAKSDLAPPRRSFGERVEAFISRLSTRNNFWQKLCSMIWLPYAFRSGITMKRLDTNRFTAVLPFRRINRNWYNAMAGAALLGNSEVAAGMYVFSQCGGDYIVVCKEMNYKFLRPCLGPAVYHISEAEDIRKKVAAGGEFNITLEMDIRQQIKKKKGRRGGRRVGRCEITFHCTPKSHMREKTTRRSAREE